MPFHLFKERRQAPGFVCLGDLLYLQPLFAHGSDLLRVPRVVVPIRATRCHPPHGASTHLRMMSSMSVLTPVHNLFARFFLLGLPFESGRSARSAVGAYNCLCSASVHKSRQRVPTQAPPGQPNSSFVQRSAMPVPGADVLFRVSVVQGIPRTPVARRYNLFTDMPTKTLYVSTMSTVRLP